MIDFYSHLRALDRLESMVDPENYVDLPKDWHVILSDVKGSTNAIEAGRYKDVNMVGVSTIIAAQNAMGEIHFPFIFGGDGATLAVPSECLDKVKGAMSGARKIAREEFRLDLRMAVIPVIRIRAQAGELKVAKIQLSSTQTLAVLRGSGWSLAEQWMKDPKHEFELPESTPAEASIAGLECRWNPLPARKDEVLALIIQARASGVEAFKVYQRLLPEIYRPELKPVSLGELKFPWPPRFLWQETKMKTERGLKRFFYLFKTLVLTLGIAILMRVRGRRKNLAQPFEYLRELTENTDYLKFDECLRMIVDVSKDEKARILNLLEDHYRRGEIYYGHHADPAALLTCFVRGPHQHIHFVDAGGGGYALAAKQLKAQRTLQTPFDS